MQQDERLVRVESSLSNIERIVCGPPPLEDRLRDYVDARDRHKARNAQEDDAAILNSIRDEKQYRDHQHSDNQGQFRQLFKLVYIGVGILIALHALDYLIIPMLIKH